MQTDLRKRSHPAPGAVQSVNTLRLLRTPRVLVADHDPETSAGLSGLAGDDQFEIVPVNDGAAAYRLLRDDADFCAAIINMTTPNIPGLDIVRYMKTENRLKRIPVIIVAEDGGLQVIAESFSVGALAFLPKPFAAKQLLLLVRMVSDLPRQIRRAA